MKDIQNRLREELRAAIAQHEAAKRRHEDANAAMIPLCQELDEAHFLRERLTNALLALFPAEPTLPAGEVAE